MKNIIIFLSMFFIAGFSGIAQVGINAGNSPPDPSAMLDVKSGNKGLLIPRVALTATNVAGPITTPATSLLIYNTATAGASPNNVTPGYYYWNGSAWARFSVGANGSGMENYIPKWSPAGTLGNSLLFENGGNVGIGTTNPSKKLDVSGELQATGTGANYFAGTVGVGTSSPAASAAVDVTSTVRGFLPPRMTLAHRQAIAGPVPGLIIFCTDCGTSGELQVHNGTAWTNMNGTVSGCGGYTINHVAGAVAPVTKTVTYETVANIPGSPSKCWITRNLGAGKQADSVNENTEASAGWYWQFNSKQGYQYTTTRLPNTTWISSISESSDWMPANDPCAIELGTFWRIPTYTEWFRLDSTGTWTTWNGPWNSGLKLHAAGWLTYNTGTLSNRGSGGTIWSSMQSGNTTGWYMNFGSGNSSMFSNNKAYAFSVRCLREICATPIPAPASGTHTSLSTSIIWNWNPVPGATGYKWSATNNYTTATDMGTATTKTETSLAGNTTYTRYIWAYQGCGNSIPVTLTKSTVWSCGNPFTISHVAGAVAPVSKNTTYGTVNGIPGILTKCWITSNLGADHQATAVDDATEASAGWYWQFNRKQGYKYDGTTRTPNNAWLYPINENSDWIPANDPCAIEVGAGWRIPTETEWTNVMGPAGGNWTDWNGPWNSALKMHAAGFLYYSDGLLTDRNTTGYQWSATQVDATLGRGFGFNSSFIGLPNENKAYGMSIRCLSDN